jgi:cell wall-associated NlpC family hydrolase
MRLSRAAVDRLDSVQMPYSRARLACTVAAIALLSAHQAGAQAELPTVLRGTRAVDPIDSAVAASIASTSHLSISPPVAPATTPATAAAPTAAAPTFPAATVAMHAPPDGRRRDLPRPFAAFSASARSLRDSLVALARAQIGRRYRFGGASPEHGFDCSGLVRYVMAALHIALPRTAKDQARSGAIVARDTTQLEPGDLLTFGSTRRISHIGIYVGDGHFVQASSAAGRVVETPLIRPLVRGVKPWRGVRRVLVTGSDSSAVGQDEAPAGDRADAG